MKAYHTIMLAFVALLSSHRRFPSSGSADAGGSNSLQSSPIRNLPHWNSQSSMPSTPDLRTRTPHYVHSTRSVIVPLRIIWSFQDLHYIALVNITKFTLKKVTSILYYKRYRYLIYDFFHSTQLYLYYKPPFIEIGTGTKHSEEKDYPLKAPTKQ